VHRQGVLQQLLFDRAGRRRDGAQPMGHRRAGLPGRLRSRPKPFDIGAATGIPILLGYGLAYGMTFGLRLRSWLVSLLGP
jgi:hypothetical protein